MTCWNILDIGKPNRLVFCESFIDLMSLLRNPPTKLTDARLVSMEGLKGLLLLSNLRLIARRKSEVGIFRYSNGLQSYCLINTVRDKYYLF